MSAELFELVVVAVVVVELFELGSLLPAGLFSRGSGFDLARLTFAPSGRIRTPEEDTLEPLYSEFQL